MPALPHQPGDRGRRGHAGAVLSAIVGVVRFPGTNCELDVAEVVSALGGSARILWHGAPKVGDVDAVVVPGGFAHGDYLRPGAIARFSPIMVDVARFASDGGPVVGICNGFQVLTEAGLLPGALQKNRGLKFLCQPTRLRVVSNRSVLTANATVGQELVVPINHFEGNYTCSDEALRRLIDCDQVVLTYLDNPNGSRADIAGLSNETGNVVGLMPHPERACDRLLGSNDGALLFESLLGRAVAAA